jgi:hypothetical protein
LSLGWGFWLLVVVCSSFTFSLHATLAVHTYKDDECQIRKWRYMVRVFLRISDHLDSEKLAELDGSGSGSGVKLSLT